MLIFSPFMTTTVIVERATLAKRKQAKTHLGKKNMDELLFHLLGESPDDSDLRRDDIAQRKRSRANEVPRVGIGEQQRRNEGIAA